MYEQFFRNTQCPENGLGNFAKVVQFSLKNLDEFRNWLKDNGAVIDHEKSIKEDREHAQKLIDNGTYTYRVPRQGEKGIPFEELPENIRNEMGWHGQGKEWVKWTVEDIIRSDGWEKDEVYWFSLDMGNGYCYQLILKDGSYVCREFNGDRHEFYTLSYFNNMPLLPYNSDWVKTAPFKVA